MVAPAALAYRMVSDVNVQDHWAGMMSLMLTRINTATGLSIINDNACVAIEVQNENNFLFRNSGSYADYHLSSWHQFLKGEFGTFEAFKAKTGYAGAGFCDPALNPLLSGTTPSGVLQTWLYKKSMEWAAMMDEVMYSRCINHIRSLGWTRNIITRDITGDPSYVRLHARLGVTITAAHCYTSIADDFAPNAQMRTNIVVGNAPAAFSGGASGPNTAWDALAFRMNMPLIYTEFGHVFWNKYATETGLIVATVGGAHNIAGFVHHSSQMVNLKFGSAYNTSLDQKLRPYAFENHPGLIGSHIAGNLSYLRGDLDPLPIFKTYTINNKALGFYAPTELADGTAPYFTYRQTDVSAEMRIVLPHARVLYQWDETNSQTIANAWSNVSSTGAQQLSMAQLLIDAGFSTTQETRNWYSVLGNTASTTGDVPWSAVRVDAAARFGYNRLLGLSFMNTPRSQMAFSHKEFACKTGLPGQDGCAGRHQQFDAQPPDPGAALHPETTKATASGQTSWCYSWNLASCCPCSRRAWSQSVLLGRFWLPSHPLLQHGPDVQAEFLGIEHRDNLRCDAGRRQLEQPRPHCGPSGVLRHDRHAAGAAGPWPDLLRRQPHHEQLPAGRDGRRRCDRHHGGRQRNPHVLRERQPGRIGARGERWRLR